jgi:tetratricopeptide (TPR) repeat protein
MCISVPGGPAIPAEGLLGMGKLKSAVIFIFVLLQGICGSAAHSQQGNWSTGLGPVLSDTMLNFAEQHANIARLHEARGEYGPAQAEYQQVIENATAAVAQHTGDLQEANAHYVLGLAELDHARMFVYLRVEHLFANEYLLDLTRSDQELRRALALYEARGAPTWQVYAALAVGRTLAGDFANAHVYAQQAQMLNPQQQGALAASQQLAAPPPQVVQASVALQNHQRITPEQWAAIGDFTEKVAILLLPRFGKVGSAILAGVEVVKVFLPRP